jgi:CarD family transcriptional regulator
MAKTSKTTKTTQTGKASKTTKTVKTAKTTQTTKTAKTTKASQTAKATQTSKAGKTSKTTKPRSKAKSKSFQVDQKIVYPSQGVGIIRSIEQKKFNGAKIPYYVIFIEASEMTIMAPVDKAAELGIRSAASREEAQKALELLSQDFEPIPSDWKLRYQMNLDLLKKGSIKDIASIVRSLYHRSKVKELPILEKKLFDSAQRLLEDELSISLRKTKKEVEDLIHEKLEPPE